MIFFFKAPNSYNQHILPIVLKVSSTSPRFFIFVSFFGDGIPSSFFPFLARLGDCDFALGLPAFAGLLLPSFSLVLDAFSFSYKEIENNVHDFRQVL